MIFIADCSQAIDRLHQKIDTADAIVIGVGAGMSTSDVLTYNRYAERPGKPYDNEATIRHMIEHQQNMLIPTALILRYPKYGRLMSMNLCSDNTPVIIKHPFLRMTYRNPHAFSACINLGKAMTAKEIADRAIVIDADIGVILTELTN